MNAYLLPGGGDETLHQSITPVNTFRLILDYYFGATYELLEDRSYYCDWKNAPYEFADVTDIVQQDMILEQEVVSLAAICGRATACRTDCRGCLDSPIAKK